MDGRGDDARAAALADLSDPMREPDDGLDDRDPIDERGIHEDAVAMPGGGQEAIDDLEERGEMTHDLMRKARPEVWEYEESRARRGGIYGDRGRR